MSAVDLFDLASKATHPVRIILEVLTYSEHAGAFANMPALAHGSVNGRRVYGEHGPADLEILCGNFGVPKSYPQTVRCGPQILATGTVYLWELS